jgi:hypothetical protein
MKSNHCRLIIVTHPARVVMGSLFWSNIIPWVDVRSTRLRIQGQTRKIWGENQTITNLLHSSPNFILRKSVQNDHEGKPEVGKEIQKNGHHFHEVSAWAPRWGAVGAMHSSVCMTPRQINTKIITTFHSPHLCSKNPLNMHLNVLSCEMDARYSLRKHSKQIGFFPKTGLPCSELKMNV